MCEKDITPTLLPSRDLNFLVPYYDNQDDYKLITAHRIPRGLYSEIIVEAGKSETDAINAIILDGLRYRKSPLSHIRMARFRAELKEHREYFSVGLFMVILIVVTILAICMLCFNSPTTLEYLSRFRV